MFVWVADDRGEAIRIDVMYNPVKRDKSLFMVVNLVNVLWSFDTTYYK